MSHAYRKSLHNVHGGGHPCECLHSISLVTLAELAEMEEDSIDPDFSFAGRVRSMSPQELREQIDQGTFGFEEGHPLKRALQRGIGVHHSGLPTKYCQTVEILFRCRYLRVVIATGVQLMLYGAVVLYCSIAALSQYVVLMGSCGNKKKPWLLTKATGIILAFWKCSQLLSDAKWWLQQTESVAHHCTCHVAASIDVSEYT